MARIKLELQAVARVQSVFMNVEPAGAVVDGDIVFVNQKDAGFIMGRVTAVKTIDGYPDLLAFDLADCSNPAILVLGIEASQKIGIVRRVPL